MTDIQTALQKNFRLTGFRPLQREVVDHVMSGHSALVLMPTGSGKSLTYQLPSVVLPGTALVVSPLKALMKDQVDKLRALGVKAGFVNSDVSKTEREKRLADLAEKKYKIFYVTPERFRKPEFVEIVRHLEVSIFVVDEAHCISQWGHDFRPEYARVGEFYKLCGADLAASRSKPPLLALTATATEVVRADILKSLGLEKEKLFQLPIVRPNLAVRVSDLYSLENKIKHLIEDPSFAIGEGSTIIYFSLIQTLHKFSGALQKMKIGHEVYHGDLPEPLKRRAQESFLQGSARLILATPAFGLGVDKPDVRRVIHAEMPGSVEAYFQEIGRAGRDGLPAQCELLYDEDDVSTQMEFIKWSNPDGAFIRKVFDLVKKNPERVRQEGSEFLREQMNFYNKRDFRVETALGLLRSWGFLEGWEVQPFAETADLEDWTNETARATRFKRQNEKLLHMVQFVNSEECRMQFIYNYFAEDTHPACGLCDNCKGGA